MARRVDLIEIYGRIRKACREAGSQKAFAEKAGVSAAFVSAVLNGQKPPSAAMLSHVGIKRVVYYADANE